MPSKKKTFIIISGKLYPLVPNLPGTKFYFSDYCNYSIMYDPDRDGPEVSEEEARERFPEYFV